MSVLSSKALHEQLSVIMAALTKAAVAEICGVVDEGYALLRLEISRSHKENEDLKKKLHLIESIVVRGGSGGAGGDAAGRAEESPAEEGPQQPGTPQQCREGDGGGAAAGAGGAAGAVREELPEVVLIKDEDSDSNDVFEDSPKLPADGGAAAAREGAAPTPTRRRAKRRWRDRVEAERTSPEPGEHKTAELTAGTQESVSIYSLDSPEGGRLDDEVELDESAGSFSSQVDPDVHLVQECSLLPPSASRPLYFSGGALIESSSNSAEVGLSVDQTWKHSKAPVTFAPFHQNGQADAFGLKLLSVAGSTSTDCQLSEASSSAFEYEDGGGDVMNFTLYRDQQGRSQLCDGPPGPGGRGKRFVCSLCSKTYATSQNLEVHMRIHTGERPFSCEQCGKKFTQSAHLKSHLSVHTGERPYACTLCSRSFIVKYSLKLHMKKCHPNAQSAP